jgi:alkanesulfonate monooxygenase SsuD/methylene tetrahydromethanopterin reductase-like flavin-dependent oxidoreductase (luciferase family)
VLCAWAEFVDRLREVGAPITATTTTGDVVYMAGEMDEELGELARDLAAAASAAMHGPDDPVADDADAAWALLEQAEARLVVTNGRFSQSRRYYDPRVLRHRAPLPPGSRGGGHRSEVTAP